MSDIQKPEPMTLPETNPDGAVLGQGVFGVAICNALGLTAKKVTAVDLHMAVGEVVTVTVKYMVRRGDIKPLCEVLAKYQLYRKTSAMGATSHEYETP